MEGKTGTRATSTQHNITQHKANKTRPDKTRHDTARQAKTKNALPAPSHHSSPMQDRLKLCTLPTFSLQTFHKCPYSCLSPTDTFTCPVCTLRESCDSAHTRHERLSTSSSGCGNMKREETKNGEAKTRDESVSVLNGGSHHIFHFHPPPPLPTQLPPAFPPLPPRPQQNTKRKSSRYRWILSN